MTICAKFQCHCMQYFTFYFSTAGLKYSPECLAVVYGLLVFRKTWTTPRNQQQGKKRTCLSSEVCVSWTDPVFLRGFILSLISHSRKGWHTFSDAVGASKFTGGYTFPLAAAPHPPWLMQMWVMHQHQGQSFTAAAEAQRVWVGGEERINSAFPVGVGKGWWGICLDKHLICSAVFRITE